MVSKSNDAVDLVLELIFHYAFHHFLAPLVDTSPRLFDVLFELEDLLFNHLEYFMHVFSQALELGKLQMHDFVI